MAINTGETLRLIPPQLNLIMDANNNIVGIQNNLANGSDFRGGTGSTTAGLATLNPTAVTVSRAIVAADFGAGILTTNSASVVAITLPTVAAMAVVATAGQVRMLAFEVLGGGIPTFAGATASTTINGTAGPTTVLPLGGAPVTNGIYVLTQQAVGSDAWSLS